MAFSGGQRNIQEEKEKKMAAKQVAVEREKMLARRWVEFDACHSFVNCPSPAKRARGGANPGFKPIGLETAGAASSKPTSPDGGVASDEEMARVSEKKAKMAKYGLKFESAGMLSSVSEKATPKAPPKAPQQCIDIFAETDHVSVTTEHIPAPPPADDDDVCEGEGEGGDDVTAPGDWEDDPAAVRPSFSMNPLTSSFSKTQATPHFLSTLSRPTPAPTQAQLPPLPTPSNAHQTAGPPPLVRKGYQATQSFKTESSDEEDEGLIRARLPASKEHKIKFSIKK